MTAGFARIGRVAATLAVVFVLSSCYVPDRFKSELRLSKYGDWALSYDGELTWAPILHDYANGKITPENEGQRIDNLYKDLIRDPAFKSVERSGKGRFKVRYERAGRLGISQLSAIPRRDTRILGLKSNEDGSIFVTGNGVKSSDAARMAELGIGMNGEFRVTTDAKILQHNATEVRSFGVYTVYIWKVENPLSPSPRLVALREDDASRPLQARVQQP